jgi:hypothetical protein
MNRFFAIATVAFTLAAPIAANAHDVLSCTIYDTQGSAMHYVFGENTRNSFVETGFSKNGKIVMSEVGVRPVWTVDYNAEGGGRMLSSQEAPGWRLSYLANGDAMLEHNARYAGAGHCGNVDEMAARGAAEDAGLE